MKWLETHRYIAITILSIGGGLLIANGVERHREKLKAMDQASLQTLLQSKDKEITKTQQDFQDFKKEMLQKIDGIKTVTQATDILKSKVPGDISTGITKRELPEETRRNLPGDDNTHYSLFTDDQVKALAKNSVSCDISEKGLKACDEERGSMREKIDALLKENKRLDDGSNIPRWMFQAGISKTAQGNFKPAATINYRFTRHFGVGIGAVNNSLVTTLNLNFGGSK